MRFSKNTVIEAPNSPLNMPVQHAQKKNDNLGRTKKQANKLGIEKTGQLTWKETYHDAGINVSQ